MRAQEATDFGQPLHAVILAYDLLNLKPHFEQVTRSWFKLIPIESGRCRK